MWEISGLQEEPFWKSQYNGQNKKYKKSGLASFLQRKKLNLTISFNNGEF
jgi:hypothetical protein